MRIIALYTFVFCQVSLAQSSRPAEHDPKSFPDFMARFLDAVRTHMERNGSRDLKVSLSSVDVVRTDSALHPVVGKGIFVASFSMIEKEVIRALQRVEEANAKRKAASGQARLDASGEWVRAKKAAEEVRSRFQEKAPAVIAAVKKLRVEESELAAARAEYLRNPTTRPAKQVLPP